MILVAQRPETEVEPPAPGINSYLYVQDATGVHRCRKAHESSPHVLGRRLFSYLDIHAPDDATREECGIAVAHLHGVVASGHPQPWSHHLRRCRATFYVQPILHLVWHAELHLLWLEAERLWFDVGYGQTLGELE